MERQSERERQADRQTLTYYKEQLHVIIEIDKTQDPRFAVSKLETQES